MKDVREKGVKISSKGREYNDEQVWAERASLSDTTAKRIRGRRIMRVRDIERAVMV